MTNIVFFLAFHELIYEKDVIDQRYRIWRNDDFLSQIILKKGKGTHSPF